MTAEKMRQEMSATENTVIAFVVFLDRLYCGDPSAGPRSAVVLQPHLHVTLFKAA